MTLQFRSMHMIQMRKDTVPQSKLKKKIAQLSNQLLRLKRSFKLYLSGTKPRELEKVQHRGFSRDFEENIVGNKGV